MAHHPDYRLLGLVGQGQFAQVYCAMHRRTGKLVAIKQTRHASEQASQEPFVLHGLSHPNVMGCQSIRQVDGGYQFVLDYCEGGTLRSHLDTAGPLPLLEAKSLLRDILEGLAYIHNNHIIHGDLKPENILLTHGFAGPADDDIATGKLLTARIGDLGSARFVELPNRSRREIGSPTYAAPERFEGRSTFTSDLYAVGVMLYELLLGDRPFSGTPEALRYAHQTQPIPLPDTLSQPVMQLLLTALQKQPDKRFPSASAMLAAVQQISAVYLPELAPPFSAQGVSDSTRLLTTAAQSPNSELVSVASALSVLPSDRSLAKLTESVESLVTIPQGCCVITARSLHVLTSQQQLLPVAQFTKPCWTVVSPNGRWFITIPKQPQRKSQGRLYTLCIPDSQSPDSQSLKAVERAPILLTSPLLTALSSDIVQVLAIDTRHLLRVRIVQSRQDAKSPDNIGKTGKTYLECFTRRGQFVGQFSLNLSIRHLTPTALPYQFVGLTAATDPLAPSEVVLITLKPFQVRHLRFPTHPSFTDPQQVSTFSWGCLITRESAALVLDRFAEPMASLTGFPPARAIAAMGDHQLLLAVDRDLPAQKSPIADSSSSVTGASSLVLADLSQIDLGLIC